MGRFKGVMAVEGPLGSPPLLPSPPVECDFFAMVGESISTRTLVLQRWEGSQFGEAECLLDFLWQEEPMQENRKAVTAGGKEQKESALACNKEEDMPDQNPY